MADDCPSQKLSKPRMKGLLKRQITFNFVTAIGLGLVTGILFKIFVVEAKKKKFQDFYSEYDPQREMIAMLKMGADFQSCPDFQ